ncbi:hypothetical protein CTI12_AA178610 [Artemisia annua]|uniref:Uncharacterized protein n=1 Tax=Artemisia annua TaxID=35608 RepID=A0A2U1P936_ARTAN|nr:hypothetical protein CTI12_AA178610 [Artemisia annua]
MKAKFFLCMRPPVMETDDGDYVKLPPTVRSSCTKVKSKTSGRGKRVAPEKYTRQLSVKSNTNSLSGEIPVTKQENPVQKGVKKCTKPVIPVSDINISVAFPGEKSVCMEKVNGGYESKSGLYIMVSSLFFTIFLGKFLGILCTLILVYSIYPHRKNDGNDGRRLENMVVKSPEKGSPEGYNKRVIMEDCVICMHSSAIVRTSTGFGKGISTSCHHENTIFQESKAAGHLTNKFYSISMSSSHMGHLVD